MTKRYTNGDRGANRREAARRRGLVRLVRAPEPLDAGPRVFVLEPFLARGLGRLGGAARLGRQGGPGEQLRQPRAGVLAVAFLRTEAVRGDDQDSIAAKLAPGQGLQAPAHGVIEITRPVDGIAQLHRAFDLVDVLPARPGGADEMLLERGLVDGNGRDHGAPVPGWGLDPGTSGTSSGGNSNPGSAELGSCEASQPPPRVSISSTLALSRLCV